MNKLSLFDLHCDTAYEMHRQGQPLLGNDLTVSLENSEKFEPYVQVMALWTAQDLSDEDGWRAFEAMHKNLFNDPSVVSKRAIVRTCGAELRTSEKPSLFLSVEDARILANDLSRVDRLYQCGVRILTPLWKGSTCIGGSHDTDEGLTEFGRRALLRALDLGMLLDISHASKRSAEEIFSLSGLQHKPVLASHSNAYEICPASRNLSRSQVLSILQSNGLIGLNLHTPFLKEGGDATLADLLPHIEYFLALGAQDHLALGCDMDGATMPKEIARISDLYALAELLLSRNYPESLVHKIFYWNAYQFATKYIL